MTISTMEMMSPIIFAAPQKGEDLIGLFLVVGMLVLVIVIVLAVVLISRWIEKVRTERLAAAVMEMGLTFQAAGDEALLNRLKTFPLMNVGRKHELKNLVPVETSQGEVAMFDLRYITGHGKHQKTHRQTVIALETSELELPVFSMRPERMWDKLGSMLGWQDIDFPDHADFSAKFVLKGESEKEVQSYLDQELLDFFATRSDICCEARPGGFLYYRRNTRIRPEAAQLQGFMEEGMEVFVELLARQSRGVG